MATTYGMFKILMGDTRFKKRPKGTWERKSEVEIEEIKKQIKKSSFSLVFPLCFFVPTFLILLRATIEHPSILKYLIILPILVFLIAYVSQIIYGRSMVGSPRFKICNKCYNEDLIGRKECSCGGEFEPPDFFNFIEEIEDSQDIQATSK